MKIEIKNILLTSLLSLSTAGLAFAQPTLDLSINADASNGGVYSGFPVDATLNVLLENSDFVSEAPANSVRIHIFVPAGAKLMPYTPPAGWTITFLPPSSNGYIQEADLRNTGTVIGNQLSASFGLYPFDIPFQTVSAINPSVSFPAAQIFKIPPTNQFTDTDPANDVGETSIQISGTPLPVNFASFQAKANGCDVNLNWITSNEKENAFFNVERSADGTKFETIDKVASQGNSSNAKRYNFVDANPLTGKSFYRVSQVDIDGKSTSTNVESVNVNCMVSTIEIYPNPATDFINVKGMQTGKNTVRVINVTGQVVAEEVTEVGQQQVNIAKLASGTYQVQVANNDQVVFTGKFVKAK